MQPNRTLLALAALSLGLAATQAQPVTVYNNGVNYSGFYLNPGANEVGDEIIIAGGWTASSFRWEYFGSGFSGDEQFRIQFYNNDGAPLGNGTFLPNSVFYDSGWQSLAAPIDPSGRNSYFIDLSYTNIALPTRFTWAVQFAGVAGAETAGVSVYHPPVVGLSEADYWFNTGAGWQLRGTNVPISFGAQFTAVPEPSTWVMAVLGGICGFALVARRKRR